MEKILRAAVVKYENDLDLERRTGVDQAAIQRFRTGKRSLSLASAEKLADALGLKLVPTRKTR